MIHFLLHITGGDNGSGPFYLELSGFIGLLGWIYGGWKWYQNSRCHIDTCHKHGKYPFHHYKLCAHHHPNVPKKLTHLHIIKLHKGNLDK